MDVARWNDLLFEGLVKNVGRPRDPLYLYVDDEVLGKLLGNVSPAEALKSFTDAFTSTCFQDQFLLATNWERSGFAGDPQFLPALAMSVLAVTLEPIGKSSNNVYGRQRDLLGYVDTDVGMPDGYEHLPGIWQIWNRWLESAGADYGLATANADSPYTYQGWARSQALLRYRDKQDIYEFFSYRASHGAKHVSGEELVIQLGRWLREQDSASRLARLCEDPAARDELATALEATLEYWTEEREAAKRPQHLSGRMLWDPGIDCLDLVVDLSGVAGVVGTTIRDFGGEEWKFDTHEQIAYLSTEGMDPSSWLEEPLSQWKFSDTWTVTWDPADNGVYLFVRIPMEHQWISSSSLPDSDPIRLLVADTNRQLVEQQVVQAFDAGVTEGFIASPAPGYSWLSIDGDVEFDPLWAVELFSRSTRESRPTFARFRGGLKLPDRSYLAGFAPDLMIDFTDLSVGTPPAVTLDGQWFDFMTAPTFDLDSATGAASCTLPQFAQTPGTHILEIEFGDRRTRRTFRITEPSVPCLPEPRSQGRARDQLVRFSLERNPSSQIILLTEGGTAMKLVPSEEVRYWLSILKESGKTADHERFFDSSWLEWAHPLPGSETEELLLAVRPSEDCPWQLLHLNGIPKALTNSNRISNAVPLSPWERLQLFGQGAKIEFFDSAARPLYESFRKEARRDLLSETSFDGSIPTSSNWQIKRRFRTDTAKEPLRDNPYDFFLWWLTELGSIGATLPTAEGSFNWLWRRHIDEKPPDFRIVIRTLESLGHLYVSAGRLFAQSASLSWLPDSEALGVLSGARTKETIPVLEQGYGPPNPVQEKALQAIDVHLYTQTSQAPRSNREIPSAPTAVLLQLGDDQKTAQQQTRELGLEFSNASIAELRQALPSLQEQLKALPQVSPPNNGYLKIDEFISSRDHLGGRWRELAGSFSDLTADTFLRLQTNTRRHYAWWDATAGSLVECGWVLGKWAIHLNTPNRELFGIVGNKDRFAIAEDQPLPPDLEQFLVMRSGLLPRIGRATNVHKWNRITRRWRVYTNVPKAVGALVSEKMGHAWSRSRNDFPTEIREMEFDD